MTDECGHEMPVGPEHERLAKKVGVWEVECTFHNMDPPMKCEGKDVVEALGPYWTIGSFSCEVPGMPTPFRGVSQSGFDPRKKKFVTTWIDLFSPGMTLLEGDLREDGVLALSGESINPMTQQPCVVRAETSENADGTATFKMWHDDELTAEYLYRRAT